MEVKAETRMENISHYEILTKYHNVKKRDATLITIALNKGCCVYVELNQNNELLNWFIYAKLDNEGQLITGTNYKQFKKNNYECN